MHRSASGPKRVRFAGDCMRPLVERIEYLIEGLRLILQAARLGANHVGDRHGREVDDRLFPYRGGVQPTQAS